MQRRDREAAAVLEMITPGRQARSWREGGHRAHSTSFGAGAIVRCTPPSSCLIVRRHQVRHRAHMWVRRPLDERIGLEVEEGGDEVAEV